MSRLTSSAKATALIIGAVILGGISLAYAEQTPGDCGCYINSNGYMVPSPRSTATFRDGTYSFSEHPCAGGTCSHHGVVASHLTR